MSGYLTNRRPGASIDWGVGSPDFVTRFVEPTGTKKQTGWADGEQPPAVIFNWKFNNIHTWLKNLDERTPKTAMANWTVNDASGRATDRDFTSLAEAVASSSVASGDTIWVEGTAGLTAPLTISKRLRIMWSRGAYLYGDIFDSAVKIILDEDGIEIHGGIYYGFHTEVFNLTANAENCLFVGCQFMSGTLPINDSAVPSGYLPAITGCIHSV